MSQVAVGSNSTSYIYNALGQLIEKSGSAGTTLLVYDEAGHLLGEYTGSGAMIQETVWMGDIPVATLQPSGTSIATYYVHTDHLGTARKITRPSDNSLMWRFDPDTFGSVAPNGNPSGMGTFTYNLRFPGQYYQAETGLNYSYYRDYDPQTGGYLEPDPTGLAGGSFSTYAYVNGNPVSRIDPLGLLNLFVTGGGYLAAGSTGGEISSGGYVNFSGATLTQAGGLISNSPAGSQSALGIGGSLGATLGFVLGTPSDLAGPFQNGHLSIGPITIDAYADGNGNIVGGGIGFGPGLGGGVTKTNTTLYPASCK